MATALEAYLRYVPEKVAGRFENIVEPLLFQAALRYKLPPISYDLVPHASVICKTSFPNDGTPVLIEASQGLLNLLVELTFAVGRCLKFSGASGKDSERTLKPSEVAEWLAPKIDAFSRHGNLPKGIALHWISDLSKEGSHQQLDFISCLFRGAFRLAVAHEVAHVILSQGYGSEELDFARKLAILEPYQVGPEWPEELAADAIAAELTLGAWAYDDLLRLIEEYSGEMHDDIVKELSAYCAGMNLLMEFYWMVESRFFETTGTALFVGYPSAVHRKIAVLKAMHGGVAVATAQGGQILLERELVLAFTNAIDPILRELFKGVAPVTAGMSGY